MQINQNTIVIEMNQCIKNCILLIKNVKSADPMETPLAKYIQKYRQEAAGINNRYKALHIRYLMWSLLRF